MVRGGSTPLGRSETLLQTGDFCGCRLVCRSGFKSRSIWRRLEHLDAERRGGLAASYVNASQFDQFSLKLGEAIGTHTGSIYAAML